MYQKLLCRFSKTWVFLFINLGRSFWWVAMVPKWVELMYMVTPLTDLPWNRGLLF